MSLKAKLEAVIYAAEEPVTLAQLAALFAEEVLPEANRQPPGAETEQIPLDGITPEPGEAPAEALAAEGAPPEETAPAEVEEKKSARLRDRQVRQALQGVLDELIADYANGDRGMEIREIAGGYRMATKPEYHDAVRGFVKSMKPPMKLSLQALETLAVIAYKQPVTAPEVSEIRGVDSGGVLGSLVSRKLITTAGRKPVIGRPILYKTTKEFLLRFGLKDVSDLPSMEEFEKMAGELAEAEAEGEAHEAREAREAHEVREAHETNDAGMTSQPATEDGNSLFAGAAAPEPSGQVPVEASADSAPGEVEAREVTSPGATSES